MLYQARDLSKLVSQGNSPHTSPRPGNSSVLEAQSLHTPSSTVTGHLFSRHSIIGQMEIQDDTADLTIRSPDRDQAQPPRPPNRAPDSNQIVVGMMGQHWQPLSDNFESSEGFAVDFSEIFDLEPNPLSLDIFEWEGGF